MSEAINSHIMTIDEVANYLKVNVKTCYRLVKDGRMPAAKVGGSWRFLKEHIDDWLDSQCDEYWGEDGTL